jgi:hypothetical protein
MRAGEGMAQIVGFSDPKRYDEISPGYPEGVDPATGEAYDMGFYADTYFYPVFYGGREKGESVFL